MGVSEILSMGFDTSQGFQYTKISGDVGGTDIRANGVIKMEISGSGDFTNGVHESSHGYDLWKSGRYNSGNYLNGERKAYNRQYSYNKSSMPKSYTSKIESSCDITNDWFFGVYTESKDGFREYLYAKMMLQNTKLCSPAFVEQMINKVKKTP